MPGVYRLKECPVCGAEHRKRGPNCSRSCAATLRSHSQETKTKIADGNRAHMASGKESAEKSKWIITQQKRADGKTAEQLYAEMEEFGVIPPEDPGFSYEIDRDGDLWR